jgi:hypothetical protein
MCRECLICTWNSEPAPQPSLCSLARSAAHLRIERCPRASCSSIEINSPLRLVHNIKYMVCWNLWIILRYLKGSGYNCERKGGETARCMGWAFLLCASDFFRALSAVSFVNNGTGVCKNGKVAGQRWISSTKRPRWCEKILGCALNNYDTVLQPYVLSTPNVFHLVHDVGKPPKSPIWLQDHSRGTRTASPPKKRVFYHIPS